MSEEIDGGEIIDVGNPSKILSNQKNQPNKLVYNNAIAQEKMESSGAVPRKQTILSVNGFLKSYENIGSKQTVVNDISINLFNNCSSKYVNISLYFFSGSFV